MRTSLMPRDGSITFGDLIGKLDVLRVNCDKCWRAASYSVAGLIERHGRNGKLTAWLAHVSRDCLRRKSIDMSDQCGAKMPDLVNVL
jgi:hypothetical protein